MEVKARVHNSIIEFGLRVYTTRYTECNTRYRIIEITNKSLYNKVLNLASDLSERFNLGLHITQNQYFIPYTELYLILSIALNIYVAHISYTAQCTTSVHEVAHHVSRALTVIINVIIIL